DSLDNSGAAAGDEARGKADKAADDGEDRNMLPLAAGNRTAALGRAVALHLDAERTEIDLGRFRPCQIAGEAADQNAGNQKHDLGIHIGLSLEELCRLGGELLRLLD